MFSACQSTTVGKTISLEKLLSSENVMALPFEQSEDGLIYLSVKRFDETGRFVMDTGATRSAIFEDSKLAMEAESQTVGIANIFGLIDTGTYPLIRLEDLRLGKKPLSGLSLALLPDRKDKKSKDMDGVLGMDFLEQFRILIEANKKTVYLISKQAPDVILTPSWVPVDLISNPIEGAESRLRFFDLRIGNHKLPALLDTGSEVNLINWNATKIPEIRRMKKRLFENWKVKGAIGEFKPRAKVRVKYLRSGLMRWGASEFIVLDFDHLERIGLAEEPLAIGGFPMFYDRTVFIDFSSNQMWINNDQVEEAQSID